MEKELILNSKDAIIIKKTGRLTKYLDLEINHQPYPKTKEYAHKYEKVNEKQFILNYYDIKFDLGLGIGAIALGVFLILGLNIKGSVLYFYLIPVVFGIFQILFSFLKKEQKLILDREKGLIAYPDFFLKKKIITYFYQSAIYIGGTGSYGALALKAKHTNKLTSFQITNFHPLEEWSFIVWYMDKNRPLPPGSIFDSYRQKDFERRKEEGFPPPLYISFVPTDEANLEHQKERDQHWKESFSTDSKKITRHLWTK